MTSHALSSIHSKIVLVSFSEIQLLGEHGVMLPPNMQGLTEEQVEELKLVDEYKETCIPSGGFVVNSDPVGRRNGRGKMLRLLECEKSVGVSLYHILRSPLMRKQSK